MIGVIGVVGMVGLIGVIGFGKAGEVPGFGGILSLFWPKSRHVKKIFS